MVKKCTQKELKELVKYGIATDISMKPRKYGVEMVGKSMGAYGINGVLLKDSRGKLYVAIGTAATHYTFT